MGRPLTTILPAPGRMRTRAMACFRRPVVWTRGLGTGASSARAAGAGDVEGLRRLGDMGMVGTGVDLELAEHLATERPLRQHASHRLAHRLLGLGRKEVAV